MKKILLIAIATFAALGAWAIPMAFDFKVERIEPTNWFVGMKDPSLQLMVYGTNIRNAEVKTDYAGVKIDSVVRLDSLMPTCSTCSCPTVLPTATLATTA